MTRPSAASPQTKSVLAAFAEAPEVWRYGYDLSRETSIKAGTLYPMLIRLSDQGLLVSEWHSAEKPGRPPRHAYRLTAQGLAFARRQAAEAKRPGTTKQVLA